MTIDETPLNELADRLFKEFAIRMRRKQKARRDRGIKLHMAKTIRKSIETGGDPMNIYRSVRKNKNVDSSYYWMSVDPWTNTVFICSVSSMH